MTLWIVGLLRWLQNYLHRWTKPEDDELVMKLILHTASLEMAKHEYTEFAPMQGCCGPFVLTGTSLPVFQYRVFDKNLMEFIAVRVEVAKPSRIDFVARIDSKGTEDPVNHGKELEVTNRYKEPFNKLAFQLFQYFPIYRKGKGVKSHEPDRAMEVPKEIVQSEGPQKPKRLRRKRDPDPNLSP